MPTGYYKRKTRKLFQKKCICGVIFYVNKSRLHTAKFCSVKCANENKAPMPQMRRMEKRTCLKCSKEFDINKWRLKDASRGKYCGLKCSLYRTASEAANWQGGISGITSKKRVGYIYVGLKRDLLKIQKVCQKCGSSKKLTMDHIIPIAIAPNRIYDKDNVQILCEPCHKIKTKADMKQIYHFKKKELQYA